MAGKNTEREKKLVDFDRHYMPDGVPEPDVSVTKQALVCVLN
jgi:hypothetical protein